MPHLGTHGSISLHNALARAGQCRTTTFTLLCNTDVSTHDVD
ncbi:hypothetical protein HMPREF3190_00311 [Umbribacter vaginalis]|nr:hypothetical protein HMPREF3190_00311 [Coriobacteriales bacterium DNF00809]